MPRYPFRNLAREIKKKIIRHRRMIKKRKLNIIFNNFFVELSNIIKKGENGIN